MCFDDMHVPILDTLRTTFVGLSPKASWRREKVQFKGTRYLLLKNPWNLTADQKERLSTLVRSNTLITPAWYLKESFQLFFEYKQVGAGAGSSGVLDALAAGAVQRSLVTMLLRLSNGALEGMNSKIKLISHRTFGFRTVGHYAAAIYHCCARLPLPEEA